HWFIGGAIAAGVVIGWALWIGWTIRPSVKRSLDTQSAQRATKPNTEMANVLLPPPGGQSSSAGGSEPTPAHGHRKVPRNAPARAASRVETEQPFIAIPYTAPL